MDVEQSMEGFRALRQFIQVPFLQGLGERVEQAPNVPLVKGIMPRFPPFMRDRRNEPVRAHAHVTGTNDARLPLLPLQARTGIMKLNKAGK